MVNFGISAAGVLLLIVLVPSPIVIGNAFLVPLFVFFLRRRSDERKAIAITKGAATGAALTLLGALMAGVLVESSVIQYTTVDKIGGAGVGGIGISLLILLVAGAITAFGGRRPDRKGPAVD